MALGFAVLVKLCRQVSEDSKDRARLLRRSINPKEFVDKGLTVRGLGLSKESNQRKPGNLQKFPSRKP